MINYIKQSIAEIKKVEWPNRETTIRLTLYVIGVSLLVGLFVSGADYLFTEVLSAVL